MKRLMLINGRHVEELRVAVIEENKLESFRVKAGDEAVERGNIYRGMVANVESSLDAAFVDYGAEKHGFLTRHDVIPEACHNQGKGGSPKIDQILETGKPIMVQVTRDAVDNKGAMLTTNISLAGRYLVLMPFDSSRGISRKVEDEATRRKLRDKVKELITEDGNGYGFIVRTNAMEQDVPELKRDLDHLINLWQRVQEQSRQGTGPQLINDDQDLVVQALRDYLDAEIDEVVIDDEALLERAKAYLSATMPDSPIRLNLYQERIPLFSRYNLESQITAIQQRVVALPSGGSLVFDSTEALTAIDVNSGKATSGNSQGETAFNTNLEAAEEVARQIRLRDIGGLFVVDFIDMRAIKHQRKVEQALKDALKLDKARSRVGRISDNGLLEINRQRIGQALRLRTHELCPTCKGVGRVNSPILAGLNLLRRIEARAATGRLKEVRVELHPQLADRIQNSRRQELAAIERTYRVGITVTGTPGLELSEERITWTNHEGSIWPKGKPAQSSRPLEKPAQSSRPLEKPAQSSRPPEKPAQSSRPPENPAQFSRPPENSAQFSRSPEKPTQPSRPESLEQRSRRTRKSRGRRRRGNLAPEAALVVPQVEAPISQPITVSAEAGPLGPEEGFAPTGKISTETPEMAPDPQVERPEQSSEGSEPRGESTRETSARRRRRRRRRRPTQEQLSLGELVPPLGISPEQPMRDAMSEGASPRGRVLELPGSQGTSGRIRPTRQRSSEGRRWSEPSPGSAALQGSVETAPPRLDAPIASEKAAPSRLDAPIASEKAAPPRLDAPIASEKAAPSRLDAPIASEKAAPAAAVSAPAAVISTPAVNPSSKPPAGTSTASPALAVQGPSREFTTRGTDKGAGEEVRSREIKPSAPREAVSNEVSPRTMEGSVARVREMQEQASMKKAAAKKPSSKQAGAKKAPLKKASAKQVPEQAGAKKATPRKAPLKRASAKKPSPKQAGAKRASAKQASAKAAPKKAPSKALASKKAAPKKKAPKKTET